MSTTTPSQDDEQDPLDLLDKEEEESETESAAPTEAVDVNAVSADAPATSTLDPVLEEEIKKVILPEPEPVTVKPKSHMIPRQLIDQPLDPSKDLWDAGSI